MTKLDHNNIQTGSLTSQSLSPSISIGGGGGYVHANISSVEITDSSFNPDTTKAQIPTNIGYVKVTGRGFSPDSIFSLSRASSGFMNRTIDSIPYFAGTGISYEIGEIAIPAVNTTIVSSTEARLTISNLAQDLYSLFMVRSDGKIALKRNSISSRTAKTYGYIVSGTTAVSAQPPYSTKIDRFSLANETSYLANRAVFSPAAWESGTVNNGRYGYILMGQNPGTASSIRRIDFVTDTTQVPASFAAWAAAVPGNGIRLMGGAQDATHGYFFGGQRLTPSFPNSSVLRLTFANDSTAASPTTVSYPVNGLWFNTNAASGLSPAPISQYVCGAMGTAQNKDHVWMNSRLFQTFPAPFTVANQVVSNVFRFSFANNLNQMMPRSYFNYQMEGPSGFSSENYGYWVGQNLRLGGTPSATRATYARSNVQRIQFSNDTANALTRNNDPMGSQHEFGTHCQMTDQNYAWFTGGQINWPATILSTIVRMSFADDTSAISTRGSISSNRLAHANFSY